MIADVQIQETLEFADLKEINGNFSISTAKPGNGVEQLRDNNIETYWQSDGVVPHIINVQFNKKMPISKVCIYVDFSLDESYTPKKISLRYGMTLHDITEIAAFELSEPVGWVVISLNGEKEISIDGSFDESENSKYFSAHFLQLRVLSMHQNGRDSHIRQLKLFGPRMSPPVMGNRLLAEFRDVEMFQRAVIR
jgi:anaphase-promoting complex subunit 10